MYWVTVVPGGGGGGPPPVLWADVEDIKQPGALVLKDTISGCGESDLTNTDNDTPQLPCWSNKGKGHVEFWLNTDTGTYSWTTKQETSTVASGTLNSDNQWKGSQSDLVVGQYTLEVTRSGDQNFKRRIDFIVISATFVLYVDQPGVGGDRDIIENPLFDPDVGHTFWRIDVTPVEANQLLDADLEPYIGATRGFYPANTVGPNNPTSPGIVQNDESHNWDVRKEYQIESWKNTVSGLQFTKDLESTPGTYNLNSRNCTSLGIKAGAACGLTVPGTTQQGSHPITGALLFDGVNPGDLGEDLMLDGGERNSNPSTASSKKKFQPSGGSS